VDRGFSKRGIIIGKKGNGLNKKGVVRQRNTRRGIYNPKERSRHTIRRQVQALEAALPEIVPGH